jgi:cytosine/adenosine deaminase-related metal-dependent hydrolase
MASTIYVHGTIITVNDLDHIILDGALLVRGDVITAVGKTEEILSSENLPQNTKTVDLEGKIVIPGLVNTHSHLAQSLLRGLAEDLPLHSWLCDAIWPLEACYDGNDGYVAARLTIAEMLKSGTTCFLESMLTFRSGFDNVARAVGETGIRACLVFHLFFDPNATSCPSYINSKVGEIGQRPRNKCEIEYVRPTRQRYRLNVH